jgi:hypothetical protein
MKRFRPGVIPTLVVALLLPLLVSLGFWQLSRGAEKPPCSPVTPNAAPPSRWPAPNC